MRTGEPCLVPCPHNECEPEWQICQHLLARIKQHNNLDHHRRFTGKGSDYVLLCPECATDDSSVHWCWVCEDCLRDAACGKRLGEQGRPEIRERDAGLALHHQTLSLPESPGRLLNVTPWHEEQWLALNDSGELLVIDAEACTLRRLLLQERDWLERLYRPTQKPWPPPFTILASGDYVLIAATYGDNGLVVDTRTGATTKKLNRRNHRVEHCQFPVAFFHHRGRLLLVHGTDWNRLDISDPATGKLLTPRHPTAYGQGENRPEHYLDYFQCGLHISPNDEWIVSNGWVWHPIGVVMSWNIKGWLEHNVWESEDGQSKRWLCQREYYWDGPLCWVDNHTLAIWGQGDDDALLLPGIRLFNVETGQELPGFAGPQIANDHLRSSGTLLFDEFLFSYDHSCEFAVWDTATGERLLRDESFLPLAYQKTSKTFLSQAPDELITLTKWLKLSPSNR